KRDNVNIEFVDLNYYIEKIKDKLYTRDYYTKTTYFRLFIANLYPQYNKAIYLDSDIIVLGDISELYNVDIEDNLVAAAPDDVIQTTRVFQEYAEKVVGVADYRKYFNAGILLMNLDEFRKFNFQEKFLYLLETIKFTVAQDQDYLNRLCKGKVKIIDKGWDRMPIANDDYPIENIKIIHFNLGDKPWKYDNIRYQEYFWKYAKKTEYYNFICKCKEEYTEEQRFADMQQFKNLKALAQKESDCVGDDRLNRKNSQTIEKSKDRLEVLDKIRKLEESGIFDVDVEDDPPTIPLEPEDIDYLRKSKMSKLKSKMATRLAERLVNDLLKDNKLIIKDIKGIENLQAVKCGAVVTCNHFNPYDSFTVEKVFRESGQSKHKKLYKVIREGNYTNFPGMYGFFFRNCDTLPLSSNKRTMIQFIKAVDVILKRGDFILVYPEQSMWWNYKKPKPLKNGAFNLAARSNVPVLPIFITMEDSEYIGEDGFPIQEYTVNIGEAIYPDPNLSEKENTVMMRDKNYDIWKNFYEEFYGVELEYDILEENKETISE
ncbi:MAG: 1-acyl-sn-glycerol-3-phosphate acyltransferase, partial [Clostridia bacterium]|nr:1-acyl-sn-glycerol-3-phosphate acyltransferase [Clostridia bacterium]